MLVLPVAGWALQRTLHDIGDPGSSYVPAATGNNASDTSSGSGTGTADALDSGSSGGSSSGDEGLLDKAVEAVENYIHSEIEFYKRLFHYGIKCVLK